MALPEKNVFRKNISPWLSTSCSCIQPVHVGTYFNTDWSVQLTSKSFKIVWCLVCRWYQSYKRNQLFWFNTSSNGEWYGFFNIKAEMSDIHLWFSMNTISLNVTNTKYMLFHCRQHNISNIIPNIAINPEMLKRLFAFNILGVDHPWKPRLETASSRKYQIWFPGLLLSCVINYLPVHILRHTTDTLLYYLKVWLVIFVWLLHDHVQFPHVIRVSVTSFWLNHCEVSNEMGTTWYQHTVVPYRLPFRTVLDVCTNFVCIPVAVLVFC